MVVSTLRAFLDRFVHPRVAAVALGGIGLVVLASVVAVVGVVQMNLGGEGGAALVGVSALVSLLGILLLVACGTYLAALWLLRDVLGVVGGPGGHG